MGGAATPRRGRGWASKSLTVFLLFGQSHSSPRPDESMSSAGSRGEGPRARTCARRRPRILPRTRRAHLPGCSEPTPTRPTPARPRIPPAGACPRSAHTANPRSTPICARPSPVRTVPTCASFSALAEHTLGGCSRGEGPPPPPCCILQQPLAAFYRTRLLHFSPPIEVRCSVRTHTLQGLRSQPAPRADARVLGADPHTSIPCIPPVHGRLNPLAFRQGA